MKCPKCNHDLESTGTGREIGNNPTKYNPIEWRYKCINQNCPDCNKVGKIIGNKFLPDKEADK
jgi:hypothetical protein